MLIRISQLPLTSNAHSPQRFAFIRSVQINASGWLLELVPVFSFSRDGGAVEEYRQVNDRAKETLIPLLSVVALPLGLSFLHIVPHTFVIREERPVRIISICLPPLF